MRTRRDDEEGGTLASATLADLRAVTYKARDSWWTVLLVDPVAIHLVRLAARLRWVTPNRITVAAFILGLVAAGCFAIAQTPWLIAGALIYHLAFILDCVDGKLARWQHSGSIFGAWMDFIFDELRVVACTIALMGGQYLATGRAEFLLLGVIVVFLDMFRYLNGSHMNHVRSQMRAQLAGALDGAQQGGQRGGQDIAFLDEVVRELPAGAASPADVADVDAQDLPVFDIHHSFRSRFPAAVRARNWLQRHRIRPHLFSGIEFQMAVFIVGPLTGAILGVTVVSCALTAAFELAFIYRFWLSTRDFRQALQVAQTTPTAADVPGQRLARSAGTTEPA